MKYRTTLKKICPSCRTVTRDRRVFIVCENKRHKQKQYFRPIKARSYSTWADGNCSDFSHECCVCVGSVELVCETSFNETTSLVSKKD